MVSTSLPLPLSAGSALGISTVSKTKRWIQCCTTTINGDVSTRNSSVKLGARVKVSVPLKVFHVPRVPEVDLTGMEGELKQYVAEWKGKKISANLPYKVQFFTHVEGRGQVKFFAHLKDDEFQYLD